MRRPSAHEVAALDGDEAAAVVDLAFRSGDHRLSAEQCHAIAKAAVRALRDAGMLRAPEPATAVLALLLRPNDANAATVQDYLVELLRTVWREGEGFSGKRPFGNSSWEYDLYDALAEAGLVTITRDEHRYVVDFPERGKADQIIDAAIRGLSPTTVEEPTP